MNNAINNVLEYYSIESILNIFKKHINEITYAQFLKKLVDENDLPNKASLKSGSLTCTVEQYIIMYFDKQQLINILQDKYNNIFQKMLEEMVNDVY